MPSLPQSTRQALDFTCRRCWCESLHALHNNVQLFNVHGKGSELKEKRWRRLSISWRSCWKVPRLVRNVKERSRIAHCLFCSVFIKTRHTWIFIGLSPSFYLTLCAQLCFVFPSFFQFCLPPALWLHSLQRTICFLFLSLDIAPPLFHSPPSHFLTLLTDDLPPARGLNQLCRGIQPETQPRNLSQNNQTVSDVEWEIRVNDMKFVSPFLCNSTMFLLVLTEEQIQIGQVLTTIQAMFY